MSIRLMSSVWELDLPASEKLVMLALADNANDEGLCWPSIATIAKKCGKGERSVQQAIRALEKDGLVEREEIIGKGCRYTLHPRNKCTPAKSAPAQKTTETPAKSAPKPSGTVIPKKDKPSLDKRAPKANPYPAPDGVPEEVWSDFLASPNRKKAGMSPTAYTGIKNKLAELAEHGFPPGEMVALACERGWKTVKLDWVENDRSQANRGSGGRMGGPRPDPTLELLRAAKAAQRQDGGDHQQTWPALPAGQYG